MSKTEVEKPAVISKRDLDYAYLRWWMLSEISANYERMQAIAYCASMAPILRKLYPNDDDLRDSLKRHLIFFNTEATWGSLIFGSVVAMEEEKAKEEKIPAELITSYKTGLMGTLAGIGDTIDLATIYTLVTAGCASIAVKGSIWAPILMMVLAVFMYFEGHVFNRIGYKYGKNSVKNVLSSGLLKEAVDGANIVGLFMIGCLSSNLITLNSSFKAGTFVLQETLDSILPGLLPISAFFLVYFLMTKAKLSASKVVLLILAVSILGSLIGLF
ncbi:MULTISPECIES: PTS system mannose/fructose/sorbose family transporter subunit IID [Enterococcus]|uniref:PTS system mannose/fructose/sorbose family transporter subunit IID n=1 Tax=Candidatus Enterococcus murrayae TaxID=2815321 RepID=A0ABS3HNJ0_9ENTE|nr:PTS system mannose/fructose/sorbose family transporter subunit IID [Enterococcus sp. MJM16]MBO0454898.1 PTS system mannose/fructose/sorbose family transporter subunit IID [Enterococcus sp. MJM16]